MSSGTDTETSAFNVKSINRSRREASSSLSPSFLSLFHGGPSQTARVKRASVHLTVLKVVTIVRAMQLEGLDPSELNRVRAFFREETSELSKESYVFTAVGLRVLAGPHAITREEKTRLENSLMRKIEPFVLQTVRQYKAKAQALDNLGQPE